MPLTSNGDVDLGSLQDFRELCLLTQHYDVLNFLPPLVEAQDVPSICATMRLWKLSLPAPIGYLLSSLVALNR